MSPFSGPRKRAIALLLFWLQQGRCCYCRRPLILTYGRRRNDPDAATIEHLRRQADGGRHRLENLALACKACNQRRGKTDWLTYCSWIRNEF